MQKKYIYLDWNVVRYLHENRNDSDSELTSLLFRLKNKYVFPFSICHVQDRLSKYNSEYENEIQADFNFFENLSDSWCIGWNSKSEDIVIEKKSITECRKQVENEEEITSPFQSVTLPFPEIAIDISKLNVEHPLYDFFISTKGKLDGVLFQEFLERFYNSIFKDGSAYKKFRSYITEHMNDFLNFSNNSSDLLVCFQKHCASFFRSFDYSFEKLIENWKSIAKDWFSLRYGTNIPLEILISHGYMLLEIHPIFHDKISKYKNNLKNIKRDSNHLFFASKADYLISEDKHFREKARFIYKVYDIKTKVVSGTEFLAKFC